MAPPSSHTLKRTLLGWLEPDDDWLSEITAITDRLVQSGDYNGLVLIDSSLRYAIYQARPIDLGIFAIDAEPNWELLSVDTRDCFIRVRDIESWLNDNSEGNASLASFYGRDVLEEDSRSREIRHVANGVAEKVGSVHED